MGNRVSLDVAQMFGVGRSLPQRDVITQALAGPGGAPPPAAVLETGWLEQAVQRGGAHGQQLF